LPASNPLAVINLPVESQKKAYNARVAKKRTRMAEEPDGGRDLQPARGVDWSSLDAAVRRVRDDDADSLGDSSPTPAADAGGAASEPPSGDGDADGRWSDLDSAVERVDDDEDEWGWDTEELQPPELQNDEPSPATNPQSYAEEAGTTGPAPEPAGGGEVMSPESAPDPGGDGLGMNAPEYDEEEPLAVHIEEMVTRLAIVIAIAGLASVVVFPFTEQLITTIWNKVLPGAEAVDPRVYHPLELVITQLKVASLAGLVVALPAFVYESYLFMRPGLYKHERRYYLASVPTSLILAVFGVLFAYFIVLPVTMDYFQGYTQGTANVAFALGTTFNLILLVMGYLAVVFQIPLFIGLAIMLGVVTRRWLEQRRLLFWAAFAGLAFTFGAIDPTGVVPIIVAITMIVLFEGTLFALRLSGN
jgi:sec-independent protein translocase protein TatC